VKGETLIKEALQYLFQQSEPHVQTLHSLPFTDKNLTLVAPPISPAVSVETLGALVKLCESGIDGAKPEDLFAQVKDESTVHLAAINSDRFGRRATYVLAHMANPCPFRFGQFFPPESFVIALQSQFVDDPSLKGLLALASSLTAENVAVAEDDGIAQSATVRQGISLKTNRKIEPKVKLRPFRTFREIEQPASIFLFRLQSREGQPPSCALFEADGGAWRLEAVESIGTYLRKELPKGVRIIY
jgi:hypothetical protein